MRHDDLSFPDQPRGELDRALDELVGRAQQVRATQGRLRALLTANQAVVGNLELSAVLRQIVESAVDLVGAEYGALGVISPHGGLEQFIHVGIPDAEAARLGHLPEGRGLLGALIDDPRPIRLEHLSSDPRSAGFPPGHPPMDSFLGVPVRVRDEVFGNLYLSNRLTGSFTEEDEQLATALAATAGIAIDNARLFAETRRRQAWSAASAEITSSLLTADARDSIPMLAQRVRQLAEADLVCVVLPAADDPAVLVVDAAHGLGDADVAGRRFPAEATVLGAVLEGKQPKLLDDGADSGLHSDGLPRFGPMMAVPLGGRARGVLLVARRPGAARFTPSDLELAADFAGQASVAMELGLARTDREQLALLEERGRIARDLHDHVIQQLFGTGLELQSLASLVPPGVTAERLLSAVDGVDAAIAQIRTVIFALSVRGADPRHSVRHRILDLVNEVAPGLAHPSSVSFSGPVDLVVTGALADDVVAVCREALVNVVKHAKAQNTGLVLTASGADVELVVSDDGVGIAGTGRRSGLANLEQRATARGGSLLVDSGPDGTRLVWRTPLTMGGGE